MPWVPVPETPWIKRPVGSFTCANCGEQIHAVDSIRRPSSAWSLVDYYEDEDPTDCTGNWALGHFPKSNQRTGPEVVRESLVRAGLLADEGPNDPT